METRKPISVDELDMLVDGELIEIPHWRSGQKMWVRIRYVDITPHIAAIMGDMATNNMAIPNHLRDTVAEVFGETPENEPSLGETEPDDKEQAMLRIMDAVAAEALMEPTIEDITSRGLSLTLGQKMEIFGVVTGELDGLESFRAFAANADTGAEGAPVPAPSQ